MKCYRVYLAVIVLVLVSLACQAAGAGSKDTPVAPAPTSDTRPSAPEPATEVPGGASTAAPVESDFPMTDDASNIMEANGTLIFFTKMSQEDLMAFYRDEYKAKGYTERELLTVVSEGTFSMAFDGDPSGKAVVIQSVNMGDKRTISIRLEDV